MSKKQNKVYFSSGFAWFFDKFGNKKSVASLDEANSLQSECCGIDCCGNKITLPINDNDGTNTYPSSFQFVKVGTDVKLRVTCDLGSGPITKEITIS